MKKVSGAHLAKGASDKTWTLIEYGERLFSMGGNFFGPRSTMLRVATALACLDVLGQDVSKTPISLHRITANGSEIVKPKDHPAAALLHAGPNEYMATSEFIRIATYNLALDSEYYVAGRRRTDGGLIEFAGFSKKNVSQTRVEPDSRKWFYDVQATTLHEQALFGWAKGMRSHKEVAHIRRRTFNGIDVLSTAALSSSAVGLLQTMGEYQQNAYDNGGVPAMAFTFPDALTDEQFDRLQKGLSESVDEAQKRGKPIILEGNGEDVPKIEPLSVSVTDSDFVKANLSAAMDMIRFFRVPPHKVYLMESVKYDNMDPAERIYVDDTLCSYFMDIETGLNRALLTTKEREEYFFKFDVEAAYALDPTQRQKIIESRWKNGMIEYDEMRRAIGQNTIGANGGRNRIFSGNFIMVDEKNEIVIRAGGNAPNAEDTGAEGGSAKPSDKSIRLVS